MTVQLLAESELTTWKYVWSTEKWLRA